MNTFLFWALRIVPAFLLAQTLFFKFTGAPESVFIFSSIGAEPYGRIGSGIFEGIAAILLVIPATSWLGALLALGVMAGALVTHLFVIGIEVLGDHGQLFAYAVIISVASAVIALQNFDKIKKTFLPFLA
jgi:uncharacterized membrane protein YphA (DoxX/SURF4 family)